MSTRLRDQTDNDRIVHRVNCSDCGAFLIVWPEESALDLGPTVFARDCPGCGADVLQQPEETALQEWADSYGRQQ